MTDEIKPRSGSGFVEDTSPEATGKVTTGKSREADDSAPSRQTHKFLQYPDGGTMPIWYRHQTKNKEVVFRGHTNQEDEEIIITMPNKSGTLAVYGGTGGDIDMDDYATTVYVDDSVDEAKKDLRQEFSTDQQRQDELIANLTGDSADLNTDIEAIKAEQIVQNNDIKDNTSDITTIKAEQKTQDAKILANQDAIALNKEEIGKNKKAIEGNKGAIEENRQDIIELEEEIEAIAPSFDRGTFTPDFTATYPRPPVSGGIYFSNGIEVIDNYASTTEIIISNTEKTADGNVIHTWLDVGIGAMIELFDAKDSDFYLGKITEKNTDITDCVVFKVDTLKYDGGIDENPLRMKIFTIADTEVDLDSFMPKSGGTFTGTVNTNRGSVIIKGSNQSTGTNFSITNGKDFKQLYINGYGNLVYDKSATPAEQMGGKTVAVMNDLALHSLASVSTINYTTPKSLGVSQFGADSSAPNGIRTIYLYRLPDHEGNMQYVKDYEPTPATEFVIYYPNTGDTLLRSLTKNWRQSTYSPNDVCFDLPNYGNFYKLSTSLSGSSLRVMLTNLRKK
jgi:hypothetical protein